MHIYHIVLPDDWAAFDTDLYRAKSLEPEGFIHCSFSDQLNGVINNLFRIIDTLQLRDLVHINEILIQVKPGGGTQCTR